MHRAAEAAALRPTGHDSSGLTAPEAAETSKDNAAEPIKEVVLLAYLQEEPPPARRRLSRTATIRAQPAGLAAGLTATQANGRPEIAQPAAADAPPPAPPALSWARFCFLSRCFVSVVFLCG